ncbi:unnamed protein product [Heterosigma akashiwo]
MVEGWQVPKNVTTLSPSGAADFMQCQMLYKFRHILRRKEPQSPALARGTVIHEVLADFFGLDPSERSRTRLERLFALRWATARAKARRSEAQPGAYAELFADAQEEKKWSEATLGVLLNELLLEDVRRVRPAARELRLEEDFPGGLRVVGIVDRLDRGLDGGVSAVVDYKTGRPPLLKYSESVNRRIIEQKFFQLRVYALLVAKHYQEIPKELKLIYLSGDDPAKLTKPIDSATIGQTLQELQEIWDAIQNAVEEDSFETNKCRFCNFCFHKSVCPAWQNKETAS